MKISRVVILVCDTLHCPVTNSYQVFIIKMFLTTGELFFGEELLTPVRATARPPTFIILITSFLSENLVNKPVIHDN